MKLIDILVEELPKRGGWPEGAARLAQDPDGDIQMLSNRRAYLCLAGWIGDGRDDFYGQYAARKIEPLASDYTTAIITREQYEAALAAIKRCDHKWVPSEGRTQSGYLCSKCGNYDGPGYDWIYWPGGECPVPTGTLVDVRYRDGEELFALPADDLAPSCRDASFAFWRDGAQDNDIIAYRLHQPQEAELVSVGLVDKPIDDACRVEEDLNECIGQVVAAAWNGEGLPPVGCECERSWAGDKFLPCKILFTSNQLVVVKIKGSGIEDAYYIGDVTFRQIRSKSERKREEEKFAIAELCRSSASNGHSADLIYDAIAAGEIPGVKLED